MKRKEERQGLHEPSIFPKNLANRVSSSDDQEVADVPEDIAQVRGSRLDIDISGHTAITAFICELMLATVRFCFLTARCDPLAGRSSGESGAHRSQSCRISPNLCSER